MKQCGANHREAYDGMLTRRARRACIRKEGHEGDHANALVVWTDGYAWPRPKPTLIGQQAQARNGGER